MSEDEEEQGSHLTTRGPDDRDSVCFAQPRPYVETLPGTEGFQETLSRLYSSHENDALKELIKLKTKLRNAPPDDFWMSITEGLARLTGAQVTFISKRILHNEHNLVVEMPPLGEPGSCLMASSIYFEDEEGHGQTMRNWKYDAFQCPCAAMRHDKVFVVPERLSEYVTDNPNQLPQPMESYIGVPLLADEKCFAHFGVMWSKQGSARRKLNWGFMEMMLHSVEDMIIQRFLEGDGLPRHSPESPDRVERNRVIPHEAVTPGQSLKPYARNLSHELRTPMQGVVGMLDVMYATIQEISEDQADARMRKIFEQLKQNIEIVQDSSRRAVEAADNVVHAYDMNMGVPDGVGSGLTLQPDTPGESTESLVLERRPENLISESSSSLAHRSNKRRRGSITWDEGTSPKIRAIEAILPTSVHRKMPTATKVDFTVHSPTSEPLQMESELMELGVDLTGFEVQRVISPGLRHTNLSDVLQYVVNDSLKVGGRPETTIAHQTESGEVIEVSSTGPDGVEKVKIVEWSVDSMVPESILVDEKDLSKMVSCVVLNALKFTDEGRVSIRAKLNSTSRYIVINVIDTGSGIPGDFLPNLFKPFSQEDNTRTRKRDGLGLGLLVAKGISRRLGGTLTCMRADTSGPRKGSDFEMRVPVIAPVLSAGSVSSSPAPSRSGTEQTSLETVSSMTPDSPRWNSPEHYGSRPLPMRRSESKHSLLSDFSHIPPTSNAPRHYQNPRTRRSSRRRRKFESGLTSNSNIVESDSHDRPLNFLIAEDNKINRMLLVSMLRKLGYTTVYEAHDGTEAVRQMELTRPAGQQIDVVLMDLWMPLMDGYEATERILGTSGEEGGEGEGEGIGGAVRRSKPVVLAVTADVTEEAMERAWKVGMRGLMTKPYKLADLEGLIHEYCNLGDFLK